MLKTILTKSFSLNSLKLVDNNNNKIILCLQCVRHYRKPRWLTTAKTKVFRVPARTKQTEAERTELMRLYPIYKTQLRSVRAHLAAECKLNKQRTTADHIVVTPEEESAEFQQAIKMNNKWNENIATVRNARLEKELNARKEYIRERLELKEIREQEEYEQTEEIVRREKESAKKFITRDKLNDAIEFALANPVDYHFAIDLKGNIFNGRVPDPIDIKSDLEQQTTAEHKELKASA